MNKENNDTNMNMEENMEEIKMIIDEDNDDEYEKENNTTEIDDEIAENLTLSPTFTDSDNKP